MFVDTIATQPQIAPNWASIGEALRWRAEHQPTNLAHTFRRDGETQSSEISYGELNRQALAIASHLHTLGMTGERALLVYPPGLEFIAAFFGCLYAGVIAIPIPAPVSSGWKRQADKIQSIIHDATPAISLTLKTIADAQTAEIPELIWFATDIDLPSNAWSPIAADQTTLAYLQYTSGSTSDPKGVMVTHGNVLDNCIALDASCEFTPASRIVSWLPHFHDMGLIYGIILPLHQGIPSDLMPPMAFMQNPMRWLQVISETKATHSAAPNFAYDLCATKIEPSESAALDLSHWEVALNGAEPVRAATMQHFSDAFASVGFQERAFCPGYGLAEATLKVTLLNKNIPFQSLSVDASALEQHRIHDVPSYDAHAKVLIGSGNAMPNTTVCCVDPETHTRCEANTIGEIWVAGPSNALGYWNRPIETHATFEAHLSDEPDKLFLRTGDLGFLRDGELYITGRLKDLIIIRGANYYPQDLELAVGTSHELLRPNGGAAFSITRGDEEQLVIVHEVGRHYKRVDLESVFNAMRAAISQQFALPTPTIVLISPGSLPKTSSGKTQRRLCRTQFLSGTLESIAESRRDTLQTPDEARPLTREDLLALDPDQRHERLALCLSTMAARTVKYTSNDLMNDTVLSTLGFDSLMAAQIANDIQTQFSVSVSLTSFLGEKTIAEIASEILESLTATSEIASPAYTHEEDALSWGQQALWAIHQSAPKSNAYHIACALRTRFSWDVDALQNAVQTLVRRHASLRSRFPTRRGKPNVRLDDAREIMIDQVDATQWDTKATHAFLQHAAAQPFDLKNGPLLRIALLHQANGEAILLVCIHHIISDFWSMTVLLRDLCIIYQAKSLPDFTMQFSDFVSTQTNYLLSPAGERDLEYWRTQLSGLISPLELPTDRPRPAVQTYSGASYAFRIDAKTTQALKALSRQSNATLFMTVLAGYLTLLYRYTGQEDLLVGVPTSGRTASDWSNLIGYFVNTIVFRTDLTGAPTFTELLRRVRHTALSALDHQGIPFAFLVDRLQPRRDPSRSPFYQAMFVWQNAAGVSSEIPAALALGANNITFTLEGLEFESIALEGDGSQCDLSLSIGEIGEELAAAFKYNTDLFDAGTITQMAMHFQTLLQSIAEQADTEIGRISFIQDAV